MIAQRRINPVSACPLTAAMAALGGKWKLIVLYWLAQSPLHFAAIRQRMPDISNKVLAEQLGELMADDLISRSSAGPAPAPVTYALTEHGHSALDALQAMRAWGAKHGAHFDPPSPTVSPVERDGAGPSRDDALRVRAGSTERAEYVAEGKRSERSFGQEPARE